MSHLPPNHWSNLEKYEDLFEVIIFPDLPTKKKELSYPEDQRPWLLWTLSKVKATKKWNSYVQRITVSWFWFHAIHTSSSLWILASINQQNNLSQTSSTHGMLIELTNCQRELHLAILKYPSNWVIWNHFMFGVLLRHTVISNAKMIPLSKVSMLQGSAKLSHMKTMSSNE